MTAGGNLTSDSVNSYSFDADNNLTAVNGAATLTSDPRGRLSLITDLSGGAATTGSRFFRYNGPDLLAEYGAVGADAGVLHRRYVPGPGTDEVVVWYDSADTTMRRWLLTDRQGSVTAVTDVNANVLAVNTYDEYGAPAATGNLGRFQYTGQIWIPELGLYHYKARDYSPYLGRFLQTDPIGYKDGLNWYAYVADDPVNDIDSTGQAKEEIVYRNGSGWNHTYIIVSDSKGFHIYRAGPEFSPPGALASNASAAAGASSSKGDPFGRLIAVKDADAINQEIKPDANGGHFDPKTGQPVGQQVQVVVDDDKPASFYTNKLDDLMSRVNASDTPYDPLAGSNSNSVTHEGANESTGTNVRPANGTNPVGWDKPAVNPSVNNPPSPPADCHLDGSCL